jgi:beta-aspartyl-peptidase (threonine type)
MPPARDRSTPARRRVPALIVHGGAGADPNDAPDELREGIRAAVAAGWRVLAEGGRSLDAVEAAVRALEDAPRFNAGRGSVLTCAGTVETDASIMDGDQLRCGAVAAVSRIANPVTLARHILEDGRHVLLAGDGALAFARSVGMPQCDPSSLITERRRKQLHAATLGESRAWDGGAPAPRRPTARDTDLKGTVGAVALDRHGSVAAATSTGGVSGKLPGRVGDTPVIGAGTYADSSLGGVSCTGTGEAIMRVVLARCALDFLKEAGDPDYAAHVAVDLLVEKGRGEGGLILLDSKGHIGYAHSTTLMPVGVMAPSFHEPQVPF